MTHNPEKDEAKKVKELPVSSIVLPDWDIREERTQQHLETLKQDIRQNDLIHPITVRPISEEEFEVIAGVYRLNAVRELGWKRIPAKVIEVDDKEALLIATRENLHRKEISSPEIAQICFDLYKVYDLTPSEISEALDVTQQQVSTYINSKKTEKPQKKGIKVNCVCCKEKIPLSKGVKLTQETEEFYEKNLLIREDLEIIFNENRLHFLASKVENQQGSRGTIKLRHLNNRKLIKKKFDQKKGVEFLKRLYSRAKKTNTLLLPKFVISEEGKIITEGDSYTRDLPPELRKLVEWGFNIDTVLSGYQLVREDLWREIKEYIHVNDIPFREICKEIVLPKLKTIAEKPSLEDAKAYAKMVNDAGLLPSEEIWVVTQNGEVVPSSEVLLGDKYDPPQKWEEFSPYLEENFLSSHYLEMEDDTERWKNFLKNTDMKGFALADYNDIAREQILPKIKTKDKNVTKENLINYTRILRSAWKGVLSKTSICVLTTEGNIKRSTEVFFSSEYFPEQCWDKQKIMPVNILSPTYLEYDANTQEWRNFFERTGVKTKASKERISKFGEKIVRHYLKENFKDVDPTGGAHDFKCSTRDGKEIFVEVKAHSSAEIKDIYLKPSQTDAAINNRENYFLAYVFNIPKNPEISLLSDPYAYSKKMRLVIKTGALKEEAKRIKGTTLFEN